MKFLLIFRISLLFLVSKLALAVEPRTINCANFGTHVAPLVTAIVNTKGPVLELGAGDMSTPIIHALCAINQRFLLSVDSDLNWLSYFKDLETDWHKFFHTTTWDTVGQDRHWAVIFFDHAPEHQRIIDIKRLRSFTDVLVIHDTEARVNHVYKFEPYLSTFKYKYVYKRYTVETTLVSDTIDVRNFFR